MDMDDFYVRRYFVPIFCSHTHLHTSRFSLLSLLSSLFPHPKICIPSLPSRCNYPSSLLYSHTSPTPMFFRRPMGVAVDVDGILYIADSGNDAIRRIQLGGKVCTYVQRTSIASSSVADGELIVSSCDLLGR